MAFPCVCYTRAVPFSTDSLTPAFVHRFIIPREDIDQLGHASNIAYLRWIQDGAVLHSTALGYDFARYARLGVFFVVRRHEIDYLRPVVLGEELECRTWLSAMMAAKCHRQTEITRVEDGALVARATTVWGCVDRERGRPVRVPREVKDVLTGVVPPAPLSRGGSLEAPPP
jgi:acyl-CoA thioester hydrolase